MFNISKRIAIIAAHPDDEVLGCGGTICRLNKEGHKISVLFLGKGRASLAKDISAIFTTNALKALGIKSPDFYMCDFRDNAYDSVVLLEIIHEVERFLSLEKYDLVLTHSSYDLNIDHQIVNGQ